MPKQPAVNARGFHRVGFRTHGLAYYGEAFTPCDVLDLSLKGCLVDFEPSWQGDPADVRRIEILLEAGLSISMEVSLAHRLDGAAGYRCERIDLDSLSALRRVLELNLGDSRLLERDIHALVHPRRNSGA